jgi:hypothetical protein
MFRRGTRLSLASCRRQLILIGAFCAVSIYPQSVFGQRELPIPAKGQQLATAATSRTREVPLPGGELLLFGLLGLALTVCGPLRLDGVQLVRDASRILSRFAKSERT